MTEKQSTPYSDFERLLDLQELGDGGDVPEILSIEWEEDAGCA